MKVNAALTVYMWFFPRFIQNVINISLEKPKVEYWGVLFVYFVIAN